MSKPIPHKPVKVSKSKKTLPVEIDWGQGMRDRLRYISPQEEALIRRNRSTDAERYYGGIRAYPDPGDTAAGDQGQGTSSSEGLGNNTTTTGGTSTGGTTSGGVGSDVGAGREGGGDSFGDSYGGVGSTTGGGSDSGIGGLSGGETTAGGTAGAVAASAAAESAYRGAIQGGVGAESAIRGTENSYRTGGVNSLSGGNITSGNIVTTTAPGYAQSASSYTSGVPAPVQSSAASIYGPDYVTDDMLPDYSKTLPSAPQYVTAADSLRGMLTSGGTYIGPPSSQSSSIIANTERASVPTTSNVEAERIIDRMASGSTYVGGTNQIAKIQDRVPADESRLTTSAEASTGLDTKRGISTVAAAEDIPEPVVSESITNSVPQTTASAIQSYTSLYNPTSLAQGMQRPGVRYSTWNSTAPEYDPTGGIKYQQSQERVLSVEDYVGEDGQSNSNTLGKTRGIGSVGGSGVKSITDRVPQAEDTLPANQPTEINIDGSGVRVASGPGVRRGFDPQNYATERPVGKTITDRVPQSDEETAQTKQAIIDGQSNFSPTPPGTLPVSAVSGLYSSAAIDESIRRNALASRGLGINGLDTEPRDYAANADAYGDEVDSEGGIADISPYQDERTIPSQEGEVGLVGDDARRAAKEAGLPRNLYSREDFLNDPKWLGLGSGQVEQVDVTPEDSAKVVSKYLSTRYPDDYKTYLTPEEKARYIASDGVTRTVYQALPGPGGNLIRKGIEGSMDIQSTRDFLGEPSWSQQTRYDLANDAAERYGRTNFQGDREGGQSGNISMEVAAAQWARGIGIPNPGDPNYSAYLYWRNSQYTPPTENSDSSWGWS